MKRILACAIAFFLVLGTCCIFFTSCSSNELYSEGNGELNVVCTIFAPFEFARKIGGDRVTVTLLQDNGADLHNYSPTTATLEALSAADVFIYIGGESDEKCRLLQRNGIEPRCFPNGNSSLSLPTSRRVSHS